MRKIVLSLIFIIAVTSCTNDDIDQKNKILLLVESNLYQNIQDQINRLNEDLKNEGYLVSISGSDISSSTSPENIREFLISEYESDERLSGALFIGNIQAPLFNRLADQGDPYWHNYLCDFFYMDLDGVWEDSDNDGVLNIHNQTDLELWNKVRRKLSLHNIRKPEIWISRIRADMLSSLGDEVELIKNYLDKNHNYRTGKSDLPPKKAFVVSAGVDFEKSDWGAYPNMLYSRIEKEQFHDSLGYSLREYLKSTAGYEWGVINVFSGPRIHHFNHFNNEINEDWWNTREGRGLIADYSDRINDPNDVSWNDIINIKPKVLFYHLFTSEVGRHDYSDNLGGMYLFSGSGLAAIAGTQHSGSVGNKVLYERLSEGKTIGEAWFDSLTWLIENSEKKVKIHYYPNTEQIIKAGKSKYKAVLLGDGTLRLPIR